MYDESTGTAYRLGPPPSSLHHPGAGVGGHHWYDEPPYESDPDDFLMSNMGQHGPAAMIQVSSNFFSSFFSFFRIFLINNLII